ncbi:MAG: thioredoxin family protein [Desulfobacteraceae bacterium]
MKTDDEKTITRWADNQQHRFDITFTAAGHEQDNTLEHFCDRLAHLAPCIRIKKRKNHDLALPEIRTRETIAYSALPLEMELEPFLRTLQLPAGVAIPQESPSQSASASLGEKQKMQLEQVDIPVNLKLFVAHTCPHCPKVVDTVTAMASACSRISVTIIDGTLFTETAARASVLSAPTLILDDDAFRWTGPVSLGEVTDMIVSRDPANLSGSTLRTILEQGNASWLAGSMVQQEKIFPGFISLLTHETWSVRLGAMVVLEEIAQENHQLAAKAAPLLQEQFGRAEIPVKGDILYALGEAGDSTVLHWIETLLGTLDHPDLEEAALDAVESIRSRS